MYPDFVPRKDQSDCSDHNINWGLESAVTGFAWTGIVGKAIYIETLGTQDNRLHDWFGYSGPGVWEFDKSRLTWTRLEIDGYPGWANRMGETMPGFTYAGTPNKFVLRNQYEEYSVSGNVPAAVFFVSDALIL